MTGGKRVNKKHRQLRRSAAKAFLQSLAELETLMGEKGQSEVRVPSETKISSESKILSEATMPYPPADTSVDDSDSQDMR